MSTTYAGAPVPTVGQDNTPPLPRLAPTMVVPTDGDPLNVASVWAEMKQATDYIAYLQGAAAYRPPLAPSSAYGFTAVSQVGGGGGTVTPTAPSSTVAQATSGPRSVVIKVSTGGAAGGGTAQFQWSNDGGKTYGAATNIPAGNHTDSTSGITVTFAGTFVADDTYAFQPVNTPLAVFSDTTGHPRLVIDHNGFPRGRLHELREDWWLGDGTFNMGAAPPYNIAPGTSATAISTNGGGRFQLHGTLNVGALNALVNNVYTGRAVELESGTANGNKLYLQTVGSVTSGNSGVVHVIEWEAFISAAGANDVTLLMGLFDDYATMSSSTNRVWFKKASADTNWQWGTNTASGDTGIAPSTLGFQRFRIEVHGSSTPLGTALGAPVALFLINEQLVGATATGVFGTYVATSLGFGIENTAGLGGSFTLTLGPVLMQYNRWTSIAAL